MVAALAVLAEGQRCGYDVMKATGLKSGLVYPLLARLVDRGLAMVVVLRYPPDVGEAKKYYTLTEEGKRVAAMTESLRA